MAREVSGPGLPSMAPWKKPRLASPRWISATSVWSLAGRAARGWVGWDTTVSEDKLASCTVGAGVATTAGRGWLGRLAVGMGGLATGSGVSRVPPTAAMIESIELAA